DPDVTDHAAVILAGNRQLPAPARLLRLRLDEHIDEPPHDGVDVFPLRVVPLVARVTPPVSHGLPVRLDEFPQDQSFGLDLHHPHPSPPSRTALAVRCNLARFWQAASRASGQATYSTASHVACPQLQT